MYSSGLDVRNRSIKVLVSSVIRVGFVIVSDEKILLFAENALSQKSGSNNSG